MSAASWMKTVLLATILVLSGFTLESCCCRRTIEFPAGAGPHAAAAAVDVSIQSFTRCTQTLEVTYRINNQRDTDLRFSVSEKTLLDFSMTVGKEHVVARVDKPTADVLAIKPHQSGVITARYTFTHADSDTSHGWTTIIRLLTSPTSAATLVLAYQPDQGPGKSTSP